MELTPDEVKNIEVENNTFFRALNTELTRIGYPALSPAIKSSIKDEFLDKIGKIDDSVLNRVSKDEITGIKKFMLTGLTFHSVTDPVKVFSYYAQRKYNIFIRFGCELLHFNRTPSIHPIVQSINGVNYVVEPAKKGIPLPEYFLQYKDGGYGNDKQKIFDSARGNDFFWGKEHFLDKFNLKEAVGYDLSINHLYFSYFIAWQPDKLKEGESLVTGDVFLESIFTKNEKKMFRRDDNECDIYKERLNYIFEGNPHTFPIMSKIGEEKGLINNIKFEYFKVLRTPLKLLGKDSIEESLDALEEKGWTGIEFLIDDHNNTAPTIIPENTANDGLPLFFEVAFRGKGKFLAEIKKYMANDIIQFRIDLYEYLYKNPPETDLQNLYTGLYPGASGFFNDRTREILDAILTEHLLYCGREKLKEIYSEYFCHPGEKDFVKDVEKIITKSFEKFKKQLYNLPNTQNGQENALRIFYHTRLKENFSKVPDNVPPFMNDVELREVINTKSEKDFGKLRKGHLMTFEYRTDKWEPKLFELYCKKTGTRDNEMNKKVFDEKMGKCAKEIADFCLNKKKEEDNGKNYY